MAALPNIDGALWSAPQSLADAHYLTAVQKRRQDAKSVEISWVPQTRQQISAVSRLIILYLVYRHVCKMVLTEFLSGIKFVGP